MQRTVFQQKNRVIELLVVHNKNRWRSGTWGSAVSSKSVAFATSAFTWEGARLHLHPMDLNYNPGVSFCIPIMKTNMSVFDLDSVIMRCFLDLIQSEGSDVRHKAACSSVANFCFSGIYIYISRMWADGCFISSTLWFTVFAAVIDFEKKEVINFPSIGIIFVNMLCDHWTISDKIINNIYSKLGINISYRMCLTRWKPVNIHG